MNTQEKEMDTCGHSLSDKASHRRAANYGWRHKVSPPLGTDRGIGMKMKIHVIF